MEWYVNPQIVAAGSQQDSVELVAVRVDPLKNTEGS